MKTKKLSKNTTKVKTKKPVGCLYVDDDGGLFEFTVSENCAVIHMQSELPLVLSDPALCRRLANKLVQFADWKVERE